MSCFDAKYEFGGGFLKAVAVGAKYVDRAKYKDNWILSVTPAGLSALYGGLPAGPGGSVSSGPFMKPIEAGSGTFLGSYKGDAAPAGGTGRPQHRQERRGREGDRQGYEER